jgi:hypothetical protein
MGVANETCQHCCSCHPTDDDKALNAMTTHDQSERSVCELYRGYLYYMENKRQGLALGSLEEWQLYEYMKIGFDGAWLDDRLNGGLGLCTHHVDMHRYRKAECFNWQYESENWAECQPQANSSMCLAVHSKAFLDSIPSTHAGLATNAPLEKSVRSFQLGQADSIKVTNGLFPDAGATDFKFYKREKRWEKGRRHTKSECEMEMCTPRRMSYHTTKATCEKEGNSYCEGHECKACGYDEVWNNQAKKEAFLCTLVDPKDSTKALG